MQTLIQGLVWQLPADLHMQAGLMDITRLNHVATIIITIIIISNMIVSIILQLIAMCIL